MDITAGAGGGGGGDGSYGGKRARVEKFIIPPRYTAPMIKVFVKIQRQPRFLFHVKASDTILEIKKAVSDFTYTRTDQLRLTSAGGEQLEDRRTLHSCNITDSSALLCSIVHESQLLAFLDAP